MHQHQPQDIESLVVANRRSHDRSQFRVELAQLINKYSKENGSNTPDFILAGYLCRCLDNFDLTLTRRADWHGKDESDG
jgi:hypothetical protein